MSPKVKKSSGLYLKHFVLQPSGTDPHAVASRQALMQYSGMIRYSNPKLAMDIEAWVSYEAKQSVAKRSKKHE